MQSAPATGLRRLVGRGGRASRWVLDIILGIILAEYVVVIPLGLLSLAIGDPAHLLTIASIAAAPFGVRFMRRARAEAGPVWFSR